MPRWAPCPSPPTAIVIGTSLLPAGLLLSVVAVRGYTLTREDVDGHS